MLLCCCNNDFLFCFWAANALGNKILFGKTFYKQLCQQAFLLSDFSILSLEKTQFAL
jgi:uncharacterized protein with ParB-like and HNH nuclease domain